MTQAETVTELTPFLEYWSSGIYMFKVLLLCILLSGWTAHTINNNIQVGICVRAL